MCCSQSWTRIGAVLAGLAVLMGAFGAHGIDSYFVKKYEGETRTVTGVEIPAAQKYLADFNTGVRYHMWHALGIIAVGLLSAARPRRSLQVAGWSFLSGVVLFSGALYVLTITGQRWLVMVAPIGGTLYIIGWFALAIGATSRKSEIRNPKSETISNDQIVE